MRSSLLLLMVLPIAAAATAVQGNAPLVARHPGDFTRILESGPPERWNEAARGLLGPDGDLPPLAIASAARRVGELGRDERMLVASALARHPDDSRAVAALDRLASDPDPAVQQWVTELRQQPQTRGAAGDPPLPNRAPATERQRRSLRLLLLLLSALLSGLLGLLLLLWAVRLRQLRRMVTGLPVSPLGSLGPGLVAVQGEAQPAARTCLSHPLTAETCLTYRGADRLQPGHRFCLVDSSGRVLIDPRGAVLLATDEVLLPGARVGVIGNATAEEIAGREQMITIGKRREPRSRPASFAHHLLQGVLGRPFQGSTTAKRLFTDPHSCFWIWHRDDHRATPMSSRRETIRLYVTFFAAGCCLAAWVATIVALSS